MRGADRRNKRPPPDVFGDNPYSEYSLLDLCFRVGFLVSENHMQVKIFVTVSKTTKIRVMRVYI